MGMDAVNVCMSQTMFIILCVFFCGVVPISSFIGGVSFWAKHSRYNGAQAQSESPQVAQKPKERGRMYRSA